MGRLRARLLGIGEEETSFERRGFRCADDRARRQLEQVGAAFVSGYNMALEQGGPEGLGARLARLPGVGPALAGFAHEGAAMALALLDGLAPWGRGRRLRDFLHGDGAAHLYMVHVGAGWAMARLPGPLAGIPSRPLDPLLRWLAVDGYGFHQGYFRPARYLDPGTPPPFPASSYRRRAFDQGLGRALWFVEGAGVERVARVVAAFPQGRRGDLWSGVGLAASYAGGAEQAALEALRAAAGPWRAQVAQGAAFAAKARERAGIPTAATDEAVRVLTGLDAATAAKVTDDTLTGLAARDGLPAYEVWRLRIQDRLAALEARHG